MKKITRKYIGKIMKYLQDYIKWAREQMAKINPPKEQPVEQIVQAEEKPVKAKKPRKPREVKIVAVKGE
jgi:hypothetical protein